MGMNICVRFFTLQKEDVEILQLGMVMKHITEYIEAGIRVACGFESGLEWAFFSYVNCPSRFNLGH